MTGELPSDRVRRTRVWASRARSAECRSCVQERYVPSPELTMIQHIHMSVTGHGSRPEGSMPECTDWQDPHPEGTFRLILYTHGALNDERNRTNRMRIRLRPSCSTPRCVSPSCRNIPSNDSSTRMYGSSHKTSRNDMYFCSIRCLVSTRGGANLRHCGVTDCAFCCKLREARQ